MLAETINEEEVEQEEDTSNFIPPDATTALVPREIDEVENDEEDQPRTLSFLVVLCPLTLFLSRS
jgi:hypothetical protein